MPADDAWENHPLYIPDEELAKLSPAKLARYRQLLQARLEVWELTEKQLYADHVADQVDELLYGGAAGGGKSEWALHRAWRLSMELPGHRTLILRTTYEELRKTLMERALHRFDQTEATWRPSEKMWRFKNGSVIQFGYCDVPDDRFQFQSDEYQMIIFDELTQFLEVNYKYLRTRCRTTRRDRKRGFRPHMIAMTNPGNRGHAWVKKHFVTRTDYGENIVEFLQDPKDPGSHRTVAFIPALVTENPHIDPDYIRQLKGMEELDKRQLLYGDWDFQEGLFFDTYMRDIHRLAPYPIEKHWERIRGIDYGYANPFVCLWGAFDYDGNCHVYREISGTGLSPGQQAEKILAASMWTSPRGIRSAEKIYETVADPSAFHRTGHGKPVAQTWLENGLRAHPANNDRITGWANVREYLRLDDPNFPDDDEKRLQRLFISSNCTYLLDTIPDQISDPTNPEDLLKNDDDHACDALRYLLMAKARRARREQRDNRTRMQKHIDRMARESERRSPMPVM